MQGPERATPPAVGFPPTVSARVASRPASIANRIADAAWGVLHTVGAHRWREGYETDLERGWSRYRGSRCTICDEPWEGW
ncbi:MAG TPA: hypothetical protein VL749_07885 [Patescibacteria group bacterium]|jgi:hypothetical protein|nr:hypothetical protein [Patescibacteria group bacterium]